MAVQALSNLCYKGGIEGVKSLIVRVSNSLVLFTIRHALTLLGPIFINCFLVTAQNAVLNLIFNYMYRNIYDNITFVDSFKVRSSIPPMGTNKPKLKTCYQRVATGNPNLRSKY